MQSALYRGLAFVGMKKVVGVDELAHWVSKVTGFCLYEEGSLE